MAIQDRYSIHPSAAEMPKAEIVSVNQGNGSSSTLELRVNIEGQDRGVLLPLDALEGHGLSGPAAVEELRRIRVALERLVERLPATAPGTG